MITFRFLRIRSISSSYKVTIRPTLTESVTNDIISFDTKIMTLNENVCYIKAINTYFTKTSKICTLTLL